ncbi:hypothetical protein K438DRAFT_1981661 [Mycena galopus ATCC 62051]|nr:hypothetical protein K438DRAFT_1981661 [Mycena galopus ATCC 62051]
MSAKTRSGARTTAIQGGIDTAAEDYRAARAALVKLGALLGRDEWESGLKVLKAEDVRGRPSAVFGDDERHRKRKRRKKARVDDAEAAERAKRRAEERMEMSWIWKVQGAQEPATTVVLNEEEVDLLQEEMRRVLQFLRWCAAWWRSRARARAAQQEDEVLREGHAAYAHKQAAYMDGLHDDFEGKWAGVAVLLEDAQKYAAMLPDDEDEGEEQEDEAEDDENDDEDPDQTPEDVEMPCVKNMYDEAINGPLTEDETGDSKESAIEESDSEDDEGVAFPPASGAVRYNAEDYKKGAKRERKAAVKSTHQEKKELESELKLQPTSAVYRYLLGYMRMSILLLGDDGPKLVPSAFQRPSMPNIAAKLAGLGENLRTDDLENAL